MKTIEERIKEITEKWENMPNPYGSSVIDSALRELASDLQAEHGTEKERLCREIGDLRKQLKIDADVHLHATERHKASMAKLIEENDRINHLNAEKEKEVAELEEKLATLAKDYSEVVAGESEMEELTKLRALLDEVKRVLTFYSNKVCYDHVGPEGMVGPQTACETGERARQLLTRLGSHE